jgi:hypothetical protein
MKSLPGTQWRVIEARAFGGTEGVGRLGLLADGGLIGGRTHWCQMSETADRQRRGPCGTGHALVGRCSRAAAPLPVGETGVASGKGFLGDRRTKRRQRDGVFVPGRKALEAREGTAVSNCGMPHRRYVAAALATLVVFGGGKERRKNMPSASHPLPSCGKLDAPLGVTVNFPGGEHHAPLVGLISSTP